MQYLIYRQMSMIAEMYNIKYTNISGAVEPETENQISISMFVQKSDFLEQIISRLQPMARLVFIRDPPHANTFLAYYC